MDEELIEEGNIKFREREKVMCAEREDRCDEHVRWNLLYDGNDD